MTPTDLMTRAEVAELLRCSVKKLAGGWGPTPLPVAMYARPRMYLRRAVESWLLSSAGCECSTSEAPSGGSSSDTPAERSGAPQVRGTVERLRKLQPGSRQRSTSAASPPLPGDRRA